MSDSNTPKDGDFAAFLERKHSQPIPHGTEQAPVLTPTLLRQPFNWDTATESEIEAYEKAYPAEYEADCIAADLEEAKELAEYQQTTEEVPEITDEELERQALAHPGLDGDPSTPE